MYEPRGSIELGGAALGGAALGGALLAGELAASARELDAVRMRVEDQVSRIAAIDPSAWRGPASLACDLSLALLRRETETALELLRCAADLFSAAAFEAGRSD